MKSTVMPQAEAKGGTWNVLASRGLRLRQHCQIFTTFFSLKINFRLEINKQNTFAMNAESRAF
jgi:hypothetical protein